MNPNPFKALFASAAVLFPLYIQAATWRGNTGVYTTATEWDTNVVPAATEDITITAGLATNTGNLTRNAVTTLSGTGQLSVENGRFISGNTLNISDNAKLMVTGNYFLVGNTSVGILTQTGGAVTANLDRGFFLSDAAAQGGSTYTMLGGTLDVIQNGTTIDVNLFAVHFGKGGAGDIFTIDGGAATFSVTQGSASRNVWMSRSSTFHLVSGSASFSGYENFSIGHAGNNVGTTQVWIEGGEFEVTNLLNSFTLGEVENGQFTLSGGTVEIAKSIILGGGAGISGIFSMTGGVLTADDIIAGPGTAVFDYDGGEIVLKGDRTSILNEAWFDAVEGTQAIYDAQANETHVTVVPEPSSLTFLSIPAMLALARRRRVPRLV